MNGVILYQSKYGATRKYAQWLFAATNPSDDASAASTHTIEIAAYFVKRRSANLKIEKRKDAGK